MIPDTLKRPHSRLVRGLTIFLAIALAGYAISDHPMYGGAPGFGEAQAVILALGCGLFLCTFLPLEINGRVLLVSLSGLFAFAVIELTASTFFPLRPCFQADERLLFKLLPNCRSVWYRSAINGGDRILQRVNSNGFRGPELQQNLGGPRIVVYGDSFIHALFSRDEDTFAVRLEMQLAKRLRIPVEVINAGVSSYGPDQITLRLGNELRTLRPDIVIAAVYAGNDYGDLLRNKLFSLDAEGKLKKNDGRLTQGDLESFAILSRGESTLKWSLRNIINRWSDEEKTPYSHLDLTDPDTDPDVALMDYWLATSEQEYQEHIGGGNNIVTNLFRDHYSADISLRPDSDSAVYKVSLMNAVLQRIKDLVYANGAQLMYLFIPHPINVADGYDLGRVEQGRFSKYDRRNLILPLEEWARINEVPFVSLFEPFRRRDANALYFHGGDDHWNAVGQRLAAEIVTEYLVANNFFDYDER